MGLPLGLWLLSLPICSIPGRSSSAWLEGAGGTLQQPPAQELEGSEILWPCRRCGVPGAGPWESRDGSGGAEPVTRS